MNMTMGDATYRALLNRYLRLKQTFPATPEAVLEEINARLEAAELEGTVYRIRDIVNDYDQAVAGDLSGAELL